MRKRFKFYISERNSSIAQIPNKKESSTLTRKKSKEDRVLKMEEKWLEFWKENKIYKFKYDPNKEVYSIDTPPPTVSGTIHMGHVMHYTQFEMIARYKRLRGYNVFFPFCYDDNGLPTEKYVEDKLGIRMRDMSREEFMKLCYREIEIATKEFDKIFQRIGHSYDFDIAFHTIGEYAQRIAQLSFLDLYKNGQIYRGKNPTIWCTFHQTALAQAEVEDSTKEGTLHYVTLDLEDGGTIEIATTRPELFPSCVAVFVNPDDERYKNLIGKKVKIPIFGQTVPIIADDAVDASFGTGAVIVCTFGDTQDIRWWKSHNLPLKISISPDGTMNELAGKYKGLPVKKARKAIAKDLEAEGRIKKLEKLQQNVGVCWRCGTPVEFIVNEQWFIKVLDHKEKMLELGKQLNWYPSYYIHRYEDWVKGLKWDWCISRQRYFGIPFPVWYCGDCGYVILPDEKDLPVDPRSQEPPVKKCPKCGSTNIVPEMDVMDTWMTSSLTPLINTKWKTDEEFFKKMYPMTMRPNGHDIIRTWTFYTMLKGYLHEGKLPWKDVMISGHTLDPKGKKISKSKGNVVEPSGVIQKYGADAIRLWAATAKVGEDLNYKEQEILRGRKVVNKFLNVMRFTQMNVKDYDIDFTKVPKPKSMDNKWILARLMHIIKDATEAWDNYRISAARKDLEVFFMSEFCDYYLEMIKPWVYGQDEEMKQETLHTLLYAFYAITRMFAPLIPFSAEEVYQTLFRNKIGKISVHHTNWPEIEKSLVSDDAEKLGELITEHIGFLRKWTKEHGIVLGSQIEYLKLFTPHDKEIKPYAHIIAQTMRIKKMDLEHKEILDAEIPQ